MATDAAAANPEVLQRSRTPWVLAVSIAACWVPLAVAAVALASRGWTPVGEFAQAELRVRDFWAHPPTLGAVGRLRTETDVSSHPGPAAWWAMYPFYAIGGRTAVALSSAVAATAAAWIAATLAVAWRRGGDMLAIISTLGVLALMAGFGPSVFLEPWNPWFAVLPFLTLVVAVWAVCAGSRWSLVLVCAAGSWCVQAHLGYAPLAALAVVAALAGLWWLGPRRDGEWARLLWPVAAAIGVTAAMWLPPVVEQLTGDPGNFGIMISAYRAESGAEGELGLIGAAEMVAAYLDPRAPWMLLTDSSPAARGVSIGSVLTLAVWARVATAAFRRRELPRMHEALVLHLVAAVGVVAALLTASRIPGEVFGYLVTWLAVMTVVVWVAILWSAWLLAAARHGGGDAHEVARPRTRRVRIAAASVVVLAGVATAVSFADPGTPGGSLSDTAEQLVSNSAARLEAPGVPPGDYVVRWDDPAAFGALGTAVLSELERRGFAVGVDERLGTEMRAHRVLDSPDAALWVVSGDAVEQWRGLDGVEELAYVDVRTAEERDRQDDLGSQIRGQLRTQGHPELAEELATNLWAVRSASGVGPELDMLIDEYTEIGLPTAVFLAPAETVQPSDG